jgi:hypothetical protein
MGSGKTRIVQAFFELLSLTRQYEPRYWPEEIVHDSIDEPLSSRKRVYPARWLIPDGAHLPYLWWGLSCVEGLAGRPLQAVADGAPQLAAHAWPLVQRAAWRRKTIEAGVDLVAALLAALPIPDPLSVALNVREIGQALRDAVASATQARKAHGIHAARAIDLLDVRQDPLVENLVTRLTGALAPDTPLVLIVDDAHWADAQLVTLIDVMMSSSAPFLVVTTAWHDTLAIQASQDLAATRANARTFGAWINASKIEHLPVQSVRVSSMSDADLRRMVLAVAPRTDEPIVNALVERAAGNPLLLRSSLALPKVIRSTVNDSIQLSADEITTLPASYVEQIRHRWKQLPPDVKECLVVATTLSSRFPTELLGYLLQGGITSLEAAVQYAWLKVSCGHRDIHRRSPARGGRERPRRIPLQ